MTHRRKELERKIVKKIKDKLEKKVGGFWFKVHGGPFQRTGLPDLLGCVNGWFIAIEVKCPEVINDPDAVTPLQLQTLEAMAKAGGLAFVAIDADQALEEVQKFLDEKNS